MSNERCAALEIGKASMPQVSYLVGTYRCVKQLSVIVSDLLDHSYSLQRAANTF